MALGGKWRIQTLGFGAKKGPHQYTETTEPKMLPVVPEKAEKTPFLHEEIYAIIALVDDIIDVHVETN